MVYLLVPQILLYCCCFFHSPVKIIVRPFFLSEGFHGLYFLCESSDVSCLPVIFSHAPSEPPGSANLPDPWMCHRDHGSAFRALPLGRQVGLGTAYLSGTSVHCVCIDPHTWPWQISTAACRGIIFYLIPAFIIALVIRKTSQVY